MAIIVVSIVSWIIENIERIGAILFVITVLVSLFIWLKNKILMPRIMLEKLQHDYENIPSSSGDMHWLRVWVINKSRKKVNNCKVIIKSIKFFDKNKQIYVDKLLQQIELPWSHPNLQVSPVYQMNLNESDEKKAAYLFKFADNSILEFSRDDNGIGRDRLLEIGTYEVTVICVGDNAKGNQINGKIIFERIGTRPRIEPIDC